jgi:hypothetical protein
MAPVAGRSAAGDSLAVAIVWAAELDTPPLEVVPVVPTLARIISAT